MGAPDKRLTPDTCARGSADTTPLQSTSQWLSSEADDESPPTKRQRRQDTDRDTFSEGSSVAPQVFDPSLDKEDREEFKFEAPAQVGSYLEQHFRKSLSKEERTAMLRKHPKLDTKVMVPPKLDQFITDFAPK